VHVALVKYSVLRLALFVGSLIVLWAVGVRQSIMMLVLAAIMSLALSYVLLRKQRDELARALAEHTQARLSRRSPIGQSDADAEDAAVESAARTASERTTPERTTSEQATSEPNARKSQADGQ
jgi:hypothetical protein